LALEQAGAYIDERCISFSSYRREWQQRRDQLLSWFDPQLMQYPQSVATTWLTSFQQLSADAQTLLRRLAWLATEPIPESLLEVATAAGDGVDAEPIEAIDGLVELDRYSLLSRSNQSDSFLLHRLVQEVTRLRQEMAQEPHELAAALAWINAAFVGDPQDVRSWPVLEPLEPHARAVASFAAGAGIAGATARLSSILGMVLFAKAAYSEAEPLMRRALQIDETSYCLDHPDVARDLNNLAGLLLDTNRRSEAEPLMHRALLIDETSYGQDHPSVARDLNNLAQLLEASNRVGEAERLVRRALHIYEASYGLDHPKVATSLNNLAGLLLATNRLAEAEPLMRRALQIDEASYGLDHPKVATRLNNLAALLQDTNRLEEAERMYRSALQIDEASFGQDHPVVAVDLNNLSTLLLETNRLGEAETLMRRALAIDEDSYGNDDPNVARDLNNLANVLQATNRLVEAEPLMRRALQICEASYGLDHPEVAIRLNNLAQLLQHTNRLAEAEPMYRRGLKILIAVTDQGYKHPNLETGISNYFGFLQAQGLSEEAIQAKLAFLLQQN
jgi:tetratricopeptide (TPR) repeat protein